MVHSIERHQPLPLPPVGMDLFLLDAIPTFTQRLGLNCETCFTRVMPVMIC